MATPILKIPVDDAAIQKLFETVNKIKAQVASLPEIWKDTSEELIAQIASADAIVSAIDKQTRAILRQQEVLAKETKELEKQSKLEEKMEKAENKARRDQQRANKKAVDDTKKIASNIAQATVNIVKWGALDFVAAGALDLWGIGALSKNVTTQFGASLGVGSSVGQRQAFMQTFQPFFDASAALEHAAEAQTDITKSIPYRILGLNPEGVDPAQLSIEAILAARQRLQGVPKQNQLLIARALGLDQIMSPDELRTAINAPPGFLEWEAKRQKEIAPQLEIPVDTMEKFTKLSQDLSIAGRKIETYFVNRLVSLAPGLDKLTNTFVQVADHLIDLVDWKNLGTDLNKFADYVANTVSSVNWNQVQQDLNKFGKGLYDFASQVPWDKVKNDLIILGVTIDKTITWITAHLPGKLQGDIAKTILDLGLAAPTGGVLGGPSLPGDIGNILGDVSKGIAKDGSVENAYKIMSALTGAGIPTQAALGATGVLGIESAGWNPHPQEPRGSSAQGFAQWLAGARGGHMQEKFAELFGHPMSSSTSDEQIKFILWELKNTTQGRRTMKALMGATSAMEGASIWSSLFEGLSPTDPVGGPQYANEMRAVGRRIRQIEGTPQTSRYVRPPVHNHRIHVAVSVNEKMPQQIAQVSQ